MRRIPGRMFAAFLVFAAMAACAVAFTSCNGPETASTSGEVTLVFKHAKHPRYTYLATLIARFEAEHPGIRVREEVLPSSTDEQHQFYVINLAAGASDFDVLDMDLIWVPEFSRAGWLCDLTGEIPQSELAHLNSSALQADRLNGRLFAVPWFVDAGVLYYRRDLLDRYALDVPRTYEDLISSAARILKGQKDPRLNGFIWQGLQYEGLVCAALEFIRGNGGDILDAEGLPAVTRPETVSSLRFMVDIIYRYHITPGIVTTLNEESCRLIFQSGRAVFMRNWPYVWRMVNERGSPVAGLVGIATVPHSPGHESAPTLGGFHLGVNIFSRHQAEAASFVRFMIRNSVQKEILLNVGVLPADMRVYDDPAVLREYPFLKELLPSLQLAQPRPVTPYYLMISQVLQPELSAVVAGIRQPEVAAESAEKQIRHLMGLK